MRSANFPVVAVLGAIRLAAALAVYTRPAADSPAEFSMFAQYSMATYCSKLYDGFDKSAVCSNAQEAACAGFSNTSTVKEFRNDYWYGVGGFVATNPDKGHIVLAFKGTSSLLDVATDLTKSQMDRYDICDGCRVHAGFGMAFDNVREAAERAVREEKSKPGQENYRVVVTGHSLGGAVATIMGAHLRKQNVPCDLYTYGSPRVGNGAFATYVTAQAGFTARVTNRRDIVTALPMFDWLLRPYVHVGPEYWYREGLNGSEAQYEAARQLCTAEADCGSLSCASWTNKLTLQWCNAGDHSAYGGPFNPCREFRSLVFQPSPKRPSKKEVPTIVSKLAPDAEGWQESNEISDGGDDAHDY